jgi:DNA repair exonuclease SbcCD ATPase subunit
LLIEKERSDFWIRGFGPQGIRNLLIRSAIPTLNKHAQEFSKILTGGELTVRFSGEKEVGKGKNTEKRNKMNVSAIDITGSNKYSKASGGEKRRIDMCCDLALHFLVSENTNLPFLFIDELFTQLDNRGKELVMVLLRKLTERIEGIVVISNMDDIASEEFDSVWTVYRRGQQSWLEKE